MRSASDFFLFYSILYFLPGLYFISSCLCSLVHRRCRLVWSDQISINGRGGMSWANNKKEKKLSEWVKRIKCKWNVTKRGNKTVERDCGAAQLLSQVGWLVSWTDGLRYNTEWLDQWLWYSMQVTLYGVIPLQRFQPWEYFFFASFILSPLTCATNLLGRVFGLLGQISCVGFGLWRRLKEVIKDLSLLVIFKNVLYYFWEQYIKGSKEQHKNNIDFLWNQQGLSYIDNHLLTYHHRKQVDYQ